MKLTIDTTKRTILIEEEIILSELMVELKKLFPKDEWKEYKLLPNSIQYTYVPYQYPYHSGTLPLTMPTYVTGITDISSGTSSGIITNTTTNN